MQIAGAILFVLLLLVGLLSIVFGLPGTLIILATTVLYAWITGFAEIGWWVILGMATIAAREYEQLVQPLASCPGLR